MRYATILATPRHYEVTALIGEGGMGQVYQATDTKLNRQVALKILPEAFSSDPEPQVTMCQRTIRCSACLCKLILETAP